MQINNWFTQAAHWLCNEASESTLLWNCAASKDINVTAACWYLVHVCQICQMIWLQIIINWFIEWLYRHCKLGEQNNEIILALPDMQNIGAKMVQMQTIKHAYEE